MCSNSESSNWMIRLWWFIRFHLWVFYLVFIAFVPLFSPAMWHRSRLLSSPGGIKTKHLKPHQRLYGSWVDFILQFSKTKRSFRAYETKVQICEKKLMSLKKTYIILVVVFKWSFGLHWFELKVFSAIFFGSTTFNKLTFFVFPFCVFYTL